MLILASARDRSVPTASHDRPSLAGPAIFLGAMRGFRDLTSSLSYVRLPPALDKGNRNNMYRTGLIILSLVALLVIKEP